MNTTVVLGLGSNLGDRLINLVRAVRLLPIHNPKCSSIYVNPTFQEKGDPLSWRLMFYNIVLVGKVHSYAPLAMLSKIKAIEKSICSSSNPRHCHPRKVDIDILFWGRDVIDHPSLSVPHPKATERMFTLMPLAELMPNYKHPLTGKSLGSIKLKSKLCAILPPPSLANI